MEDGEWIVEFDALIVIFADSCSDGKGSLAIESGRSNGRMTVIRNSIQFKQQVARQVTPQRERKTHGWSAHIILSSRR